MFSTASQPSGRYYFEGESPFNKLDISFLTQAEFDTICSDKRIGSHAIVPNLLHVAGQIASAEADLRKRAPWTAVTITGWETEAGRLLYVHLEAVKARLRGRVAKQSDTETRADLLRMLSNSHQTSGGNWVSLAQQCVGL
ncbi:MAG: hypothetical protein Q7S79_03640 [bacterium]|nr:hypothetical protein [bacterium]